MPVSTKVYPVRLRVLRGEDFDFLPRAKHVQDFTACSPRIQLSNYAHPQSELKSRRTANRTEKPTLFTATTSASSASKSRTSPSASSTSTRPSTAARTTTSSSPSLPRAKPRGHPRHFPDHGLRRHLGVEHGRRSRLSGNRRARRPRLRRRRPRIPLTSIRKPCDHIFYAVVL